MSGHDLLIKFGSERDMSRLFNHGEVFMNTLAYHRGNESDIERHDPNEGLERIMQIRGATLYKKNRVSGENQKVALITSGIGRIKNSNLDKLNVFCMFRCAIPLNEEVALSKVVNERVMNGFGDTAVIIADAAEFVTRVKNEALQRGLFHSRKLVDYVNLKQWDNEVGPFVKGEEFSHQQELRIAIFDKKAKTGPLCLSIGSISDIAFLVPVKDLLEYSVKSCTAT